MHDSRPPVPWRLLAGLLLLCGLPATGAALFYLNIRGFREWLDSVPFDSVAWKAADAEGRYRMSWGLRRGMLNGKTTEEVKEMLGVAASQEVIGPGLPEFAAHGAAAGTEVWYYHLGGEKHDSGFGPSGAVLAVDFMGGRVVRVRKIVH